MASSSPPPPTWKYDVFPSFSGEDVRKSFLSHLLDKLKGKSIITLSDNGIERSRQIAPELLLAIRKSRISIVVFSKNYASSTWCLNELVQIHECFKEMNQMVIPVFYEVDPSHVRKQTGEFGKAFATTCKGKKEDDKKRWKKALEEVASIAGEDSRNWSDEAEMIDHISKDVLNKLLLTPSDDFRDFVGIEAHVEAIVDSKLCLESGGVRMVGIWGPSGIGKTTIATALFSRLSSTQFDHRAFLNYKRAIKDKHLADVRIKLAWANHFLSEILCQKNIKIESAGVVKQRLKHRKVLIVLDDVDEIELLETLVGNVEWFGFGSRIVVVTQDRALLESHEIDLIYEVQLPSKDLALQMFCQSAFGKTSPPDGFMELAAEVANLSGNLPLGLNVSGSSLRKKNKEYWVEMMPRLRNGLNGKIEKTLRVSYDGLDEKDDQDIFVYIACLFNGESVSYIKNMLEKSCYTSVNTSLRTLAEKSLARITTQYEIVQMHILLEKLGKEIVRSESASPGKRRFLVDPKDIFDVFNDNTGTKNVLGIRLDTSEIYKPLFIDEISFQGMRNLRFIKFYKERWRLTFGEIILNLPRGLVYLPSKLILLHWDEYPAKYIPSSFSAEYLVELRMKDSKLEKLWEGAKPCRSLKVINLSGSRDLKEIPDLSNAANLEMLDLSSCTSLVTLPSSIRNLKKLIDLCMFGCSNLEVLPTDANLESLDYLDLRECSRLRSFPRISRNISWLLLDGTTIEEEDCFWIENLSRLTRLDWENCPLRCMPPNFHPEHLTQLRIRESKLEKLWEGVQSLTKLTEMDLSNCESPKEIPDLLKANYGFFNLQNCTSLVKLTSSIQHLNELTTLNISGCTNLEDLPRNINLVSLTTVNLSGCSRLRTFPQISTSIEELNLSNTAIEEVPSWIENIDELTHLQMRGCEKLKEISANIWNLKHLQCVDFTDCGGVTSVSDTSLVKTVAELHEEMYLSCSDSDTELLFHHRNSDTEFLFHNCFNLDQDAQKFILQSDFRYAILPGKKVPTYFTHRAPGSSLIVPLPQSSRFQNHLGFTAYIIPNPNLAATGFQYVYEEIIVHWKFRGVEGAHEVCRTMNLAKMDHLLVFHFNILFQEDPPSQLDCENVEFEFKYHHTSDLGFQTSSSTPKECGARVLDVFPSLDASDRSAEAEYTDQSEYSESMALNLELSLGLGQAPPHVSSRSKVPSPSISSRNFHGGEASLNLSLSPFDPCLEGDSLCFDPMITEQQDAWTSSEDHSLSPQLTNYFI